MSELKVNSIKGTGASSAAITVHASDGTATGKLTNLPGRNIVVNGSMQCAQYGTSSTATGFKTVDRWKFNGTWPGSAITTAQSDVAAGTTPYEKGFRKAWKVTNVTQSSTGAGDFLHIDTKLEAQDIANSGWHYTSASSYITLSFWVKSSVAQTFYGFLYTSDGAAQQYPFSFALSADTWTKVTKTIPGHANLTFDNNVNEGLRITIAQFYGTNYTAPGVTLDAWGAYSGSANLPDNTSTWFTTNAATFELTGVQLEVGDVNTDFDFRPYCDELHRCQRYYYELLGTHAYEHVGIGYTWSTTSGCTTIYHPQHMRAAPTGTVTGNLQIHDGGDIATSGESVLNTSPRIARVDFTGSGFTVGRGCQFRAHNDLNAKITMSAEL